MVEASARILVLFFSSLHRGGNLATVIQKTKPTVLAGTQWNRSWHQSIIMICGGGVIESDVDLRFFFFLPAIDI